MKKIKIVHVLAYYGDYHGGIQINVRELARRQLASGYSVKIITSDLYGNQKNIDGVPVVRVKALFSAFRVPFTPLLPFVLIKEKCDILHIHLPLPWLDLCAILKKLIDRKTKLVVTIHNYIPVNSLFSELLGWIHNNFLIRAVLNIADVVTTSTDEFAESLPYSLPKHKLMIVPYGVDIHKFKFSSTYDKKQVLFVGRLIPEKGLHVLMKAMKYVRRKNRNIKLLAICGENYDFRNYEKKIRAMDDGFLEIKKNIPNASIGSYYGNSACFVMPSLDIDSFGIVLLESMACGCPVVVSDLPGPRAIALKGHGGIAPKGNYKLLGEAIHSALKLPTIIRKKVRLYVENSFSWDYVYRQTEKAYSI